MNEWVKRDLIISNIFSRIYFNVEDIYIIEVKSHFSIHTVRNSFTSDFLFL